MRYLKFFALCGLLLGWGVPLQAAPVSGLYETEVEVADQGREARAHAMSSAMTAVLVKVTGSETIPAEAVLQEALRDASRYVRQYRYRSEAGNGRGAGGASGQNRLLLWVSFDSGSIDSLLQRFGFSTWSAARPDTLVWLAVEEGSRRVLVGANDQGLVREVLDAEAQRRAIPLRLPLLDLTDQSRVSAVDVWGGFTDVIAAASQRYESQAVLIGKLYRAGKGWEARWTLRYRGEQHEWQQGGAAVQQVIASGVGGTCDHLLQRYAASSEPGMDQLVLRVEGVKGMKEFRRVNDYLQSLHGVTAVTLHRVDASSSSFVVRIEGGRDRVLQAIAMGDVLVKKASQVSAPIAAPLPQVLPVGAARVAPKPQGAPATVPPEQDSTQPVDTEFKDDATLPAEGPQVMPLEVLVYRLLS